MVMKSLRGAAAHGIGKFILFGLLVLAVAGLALMDVGGFFRGDTGSNNVIKVKNQTVSINEFDRLVRQQLQPSGISAKDAYKMGYLNQIIAGKVRAILLNDLVTKAGIEISQQRAAKHIANLIKPMTDNGQSSAQILTQILRNNGMTEQKFLDAIKEEMADDILNEAISGSIAATNTDIIDGLYQYQKEIRTIEYLKFLNDEQQVDSPNEKTIQEHYNATMQRYKVPELRSVDVIILDDSKINKNTDLSAEEILNKKFDLVEQLEDLTTSGLSSDDIKKQIPVITTSLIGLQANGQLNDSHQAANKELAADLVQIAEEAFALEQGETSMAIELPGAKFIVLKLIDMQLETYKPLKQVKSDVIASWTKSEQIKLTQEKIADVQKRLKAEKLSLKDYATQNKRNLRTIENLARDNKEKPFTGYTLGKIFKADKSDILTLTIDGGIAITKTTDIILPKIDDKKRGSDEYIALKNAILSSESTDVLSTILEAAHNEDPALINNQLLERIYGEHSQSY